MALSPVEILLLERDEVDVFFRVQYLRYCIPGQPAAQCFFFHSLFGLCAGRCGGSVCVFEILKCS